MSEAIRFDDMKAGSFFDYKAESYVKTMTFIRDGTRINAVRLDDGLLCNFEERESVYRQAWMSITGLPCDKYGRCMAT